MKLLLIWPQIDQSLFSYKPLLDIFGDKGQFFPLPLISAAAHFPEHWELRLLDMQFEQLSEKDIGWADYVLVAADNLQIDSLLKNTDITRANAKVIVFGEALSALVCQGLDHITMVKGDFGEMSKTCREKTVAEEITEDMVSGNLKQTYETIPCNETYQFMVPRYDLVEPRLYFSLSLKLSKGQGRNYRRKPLKQIVSELDILYSLSGGFKSIYLTDDDLIGDVKENNERREQFILLLEYIHDWQCKNSFPFDFFFHGTLSSAHDELTGVFKKMADAGISIMLLPLNRCHQTTFGAQSRDEVQKICSKVDFFRKQGIGVFGKVTIESHIKVRDVDFFAQLIKNTSIPVVFVDTSLHGNDDHKLNEQMQLRLLREIYQPSKYFARCIRWISEWNDEYVAKRMTGTVRANQDYRRVIRGIMLQGFKRRYAISYWYYLIQVLVRFSYKPARFSLAVFLGYMYEVMYGQLIASYTKRKTIPLTSHHSIKKEGIEVNG
ncbi:DUF4070 domain-containing protein [Chitinispirillales bacterium ANBcel5]|uniref:DUF4070 domain-containing protein n=1 Tax=Cellulosispirillum alkaliphilum TaxID=3039283 RepID=UPI002A50A20F|nr:DUF4070 domain-containing protein [Chitinispirillales bacterium ANBcel5]